MKKVSLLLLFVFIGVFSHAARKLPGYYINAEGQKTEVIMKVPFRLFGKPNFERLQRRVKYFDSSKKKHTLRASEAQEISFQHNNKTYRMLSRKIDIPVLRGLIKDNQRFLHLIKDGNLKLFKFYASGNSGGSMAVPGYGIAGMGNMGVLGMGMRHSYPGTPYHIEKYLMQKNDEPLFKTNLLFFRKDMTEYLKDCSALAKKIEDKVYNIRDLEQIVDEYNSKCQ